MQVTEGEISWHDRMSIFILLSLLLSPSLKGIIIYSPDTL